MTKTIWNMSELAREIGTSRQLVAWRARNGHLPAPAYVSRSGVPYWSAAQAEAIISSWKALR